MSVPKSAQTPYFVLLLLGVFSTSTAAIFSRFAFEYAGRGDFSLVISFGRLLVAGLILLPMTRQALRREGGQSSFWQARHLLLGAAAALALHFITWISSLTFTSVAISSAMVNTVPIWLVLIGWLYQHQKPTRAEFIGLAIAMAGAALIALNSLLYAGVGGMRSLAGALLALVSSVCVSVYFLLGKEAQARGLPTAGYAGAVYLLAGLMALPTPMLTEGGYGAPVMAYVMVLCIGLVPQLIGHTTINWSLKHLPQTLVGVTLLFDTVFAGILAWLLLHELPSALDLVGAVLVLVAVTIILLNPRPTPTTTNA